MSDLFKDTFTGRLLENIVQKFDEEGKECYEFSFSGTHQKLRVHKNLAADIWIDDDKLDTLHFPRKPNI